MKKLFVFGEKSRHPQEIEVAENTSLQDILSVYLQQHGIAVVDESYQLFGEDGEEALNKSNGHPLDFKDKHRVQCHRCSHIDIRLQYQHHQHQVTLNPAASGARILAQLPKYFLGLTPKEAANLRLKVSEDVFIDNDEHIGSFVEYPHCHLEIDVVPKKTSTDESINGPVTSAPRGC